MLFFVGLDRPFDARNIPRAFILDSGAFTTPLISHPPVVGS